MRRPDRSEQKQRAIAHIKQLVADRGYPPSTQELMHHLGYRSTATVHNLLADLQREGRITRQPHQARTIRVVE